MTRLAKLISSLPDTFTVVKEPSALQRAAFETLMLLLMGHSSRF